MKDENSKRKSIKNKVCLSIFSLIFFLILVEISLRIIGYIYISSRVEPGRIFSKFKKESDVILCLGDSFTFGGGVDAKDSYPAQLQAILDSNISGKSFKVINAGVCEYNSAQVLRDLPKNIHRYEPNLCILLVGASNRFNFWGFNKEKTIYSNLKNLVYSLRVYKVLKITALNFKIRFLLWKLKQGPGPEVFELLSEHTLLNAINPDVCTLKEVADANHDLVHYLKSIGEDKRASKVFKKSLEVSPDSDLYVYQVGEFCEDIYEDTIDHDWTTILTGFQEKFKNNPDLKNDRLFIDYFRFFQKIKVSSYPEKKIAQRLKEDLEQIFDMCEKKNIKIIVQDYPYPYPMADDALRDMAVKHSLPFFENGKIFSKLLIGGKKKTYFLDDSHCTTVGYRVIAENAYEAICSNGVILE